MIILTQHDSGILSGIFFLGHVINLKKKKNERNEHAPLRRWIECICWQLAGFFLLFFLSYCLFRKIAVRFGYLSWKI